MVDAVDAKADVVPGAYVIDVQLADGRAFLARVVVAAQRTRFVDLDDSRAVPPDNDEDH
ncbi:hypothetical protein [Piscinibacter sp. XHJ-5]|uniref:hypothetical protein n=1 Tax=Piscinibacter sp. XHJ-5 TaxID=3037797 RepID=UPI0024534604|nr:hypothetical protein [Piscinibacter sp. XHJ-5]